MEFIASQHSLKESLKALTKVIEVSLSSVFVKSKTRIEKIKEILKADWIDHEDIKNFKELSLEEIIEIYNDQASREDLTFIYCEIKKNNNYTTNISIFLKILDKLIKILLGISLKSKRDKRFFFRRMQRFHFKNLDDYHSFSFLYQLELETQFINVKMIHNEQKENIRKNRRTFKFG